LDEYHLFIYNDAFGRPFYPKLLALYSIVWNPTYGLDAASAITILLQLHEEPNLIVFY